MALKFRGVHGTCVAHAESILKNGVRAGAGRAGTGFYLWAYHANPQRAYELAKDWYQWRLSKGDYESCPASARAMAILTFEIEVDMHSYLNLNQARHHELLRAHRAKFGPEVSQAKVFDEYLAAQAEFKLQAYGAQLKVVEAMVPLPDATKKRDKGAPLTPGADAFIVLQEGLSALLVTECLPTSLRS